METFQALQLTLEGLVDQQENAILSVDSNGKSSIYGSPHMPANRQGSQICGAIRDLGLRVHNDHNQDPTCHKSRGESLVGCYFPQLPN